MQLTNTRLCDFLASEWPPEDHRQSFEAKYAAIEALQDTLAGNRTADCQKAPQRRQPSCRPTCRTNFRPHCRGRTETRHLRRIQSKSSAYHQKIALYLLCHLVVWDSPSSECAVRLSSCGAHSERSPFQIVYQEPTEV